MRFLLPLIFCCAAGLAHAADGFTFTAPPGPHGVGLQVIHQYDYARVYRGRFDLATGQPITGEKARPVQTLVWYPATGGGKPVAYRDYIRTTATEETFGRSEAEIDAAVVSLQGSNYAEAGPERHRAALAQRMWAVRDAKPTAGKFPVVIYAPSFSASAAENADLCEYLAGHGYVVLASPSIGTRSRNMTDDIAGIETQAADIGFLIGYAHGLPHADTSRIGVVGYSWGGIANVFAAARDDRIKALVSLDGSVRYFPELVSAAKYVVPERVAVPMLYMAQRPMSMEKIAKRGKPNASFLNEMKYSDLYVGTMHPMEHFAFSSTFLRFASAPRFDEYTRDEVNQAHGWTARYVHQFLNAYLKDDRASLVFLGNQTAKNGVPAHMLTLDVSRATGMPPSRETMAVDLAKVGFEHAHEVYQKMRKAHEKFDLSEAEVVAWGYQLLRSNVTKPAIEIFKLSTMLYPRSGNTFDSLGEAYAQDGNTALAIKNYQRSLELDPKNDNAVERLKVLAGGVGAAKG